jgi:hypothetical protein
MIIYIAMEQCVDVLDQVDIVGSLTSLATYYLLQSIETPVASIHDDTETDRRNKG